MVGIELAFGYAHFGSMPAITTAQAQLVSTGLGGPCRVCARLACLQRVNVAPSVTLLLFSGFPKPPSDFRLVGLVGGVRKANSWDHG